MQKMPRPSCTSRAPVTDQTHPKTRTRALCPNTEDVQGPSHLVKGVSGRWHNRALMKRAIGSDLSSTDRAKACEAACQLLRTDLLPKKLSAYAPRSAPRHHRLSRFVALNKSEGVVPVLFRYAESDTKTKDVSKPYNVLYCLK